jgi:hypothetical protein
MRLHAVATRPRGAGGPGDRPWHAGRGAAGARGHGTPASRWGTAPAQRRCANKTSGRTCGATNKRTRPAPAMIRRRPPPPSLQPHPAQPSCTCAQPSGRACRTPPSVLSGVVKPCLEGGKERRERLKRRLANRQEELVDHLPRKRDDETSLGGNGCRSPDDYKQHGSDPRIRRGRPHARGKAPRPPAPAGKQRSSHERVARDTHEGTQEGTAAWAPSAGWSAPRAWDAMSTRSSSVSAA